MYVTLAVLVVAVALSYARGGRLGHLGETRLRWSWLLFVGLGAQAAVNLGVQREVLVDASTPGVALLVASQLLVLAWLVLNRHLKGVLVIATGLAMNAVVVAANGAMPVDPEAIQAIGAHPASLDPGTHTLLAPDTHLPWLADIWAVPPLRSIISVGDVVLAVGLLPLVHGLMTRRPDPKHSRQHA